MSVRKKRKLNILTMSGSFHPPGPAYVANILELLPQKLTMSRTLDHES